MNNISPYNLLLKITDAIVETVRECGDAPAGVLYAGLQSQGCTHTQFNQIMNALVGAGKLTRRGDIYRVAGAAQ
jgi:hypothetical protein